MDEVYALYIFWYLLNSRNVELHFCNSTFLEFRQIKDFRGFRREISGMQDYYPWVRRNFVPFLSYPELLTDQTVVVQVDNIGCHFAWKNGYARSDNMASILVRTLVLLSEFLNCKVIVNHHPRESSWEIKLADRLSRESSTTSQDRKLVQSFQRRNLPSVFSVWMENPSEDWDLPKKIMSVMSR